MHDLDGGRHIFTQPGRKLPKLIGCLVFIDFLVAARRRRGLFTRAGIEAQHAVERGIALLQLEEDLVRLLLIFEIRSVERLKEIEIEISWGLRGGPLVGRPEEKVATATGARFAPLDLVFPDSVSGDVGGSIRVLENDAP